MANTALDGKPYAGNPHVRIDEGDGASAKPRRSSLLYGDEIQRHMRGLMRKVWSVLIVSGSLLAAATAQAQRTVLPAGLADLTHPNGDAATAMIESSEVNDGFGPENLFDNTWGGASGDDSRWLGKFAEDTTTYFIYGFTTPTAVNAVRLRVPSWNCDARVPTDWTIYGSNDNTSWAEIHNEKDDSGIWMAQSTRVYAFENMVAYKYYKFVVNAIRTPSEGWAQLSEVEFFSFASHTLTEDEDWTSRSEAFPNAVNLNGHKLTVARLEGTCEITDTNGRDYELLDYIESTGTQYILTGLKATATLNASVLFRVKSYVSNSAIFGCGAYTGDAYLFIMQSNQMRYFSTTTTVFGSVPTTADLQFTRVGTSVTVTQTGGSSKTSTISSAIGNLKNDAQKQIALFAMNDGTRKSKIRAYSYVFTESNGTVQRNFVPARRLSDGKVGLLDLVHLDSTSEFYPDNAGGNFTAGSATNILHIGTAGGELHVNVAGGSTLENTAVSLSGSLKLVKEGAGSFKAAKTNQTYAGGTEVTGGTFTTPFSVDGMNAKTDATAKNQYLGAQGSEVRVNEDAELDIAGNYDYYVYRLVLAGGMLRNTANGAGCLQAESPSGVAGLGSLSLTADSTLVLRSNTLLSGGSEPIDLGGHTLTVDCNVDSKLLYLKKNMVNGTLYMKGHSSSKSALKASAAVSLTNVTLIDDTGLDMANAMNVDNYTARFAWTANTYCVGAAALNVSGIFRPEGSCFYGCKLANGATLDLSTQTGVWCSTSAATSYGSKTVTFADGAAVTIDVGERVLDKGDKVVAWDVKPANAAGLSFRIVGTNIPVDVLPQVTDDGIFYTAEPDQIVAAVWTGAKDGNIDDPANWTCTNAMGRVDTTGTAVPGERALVYFTGAIAPSIPAGTSFAVREITFNATLAGDCDWRGLSMPVSGKIDLKGHNLTVSQLEGDCEITDTNPVGYELLDYIESTGTQYILTGLKATETLNASASFRVKSYVSNAAIFGCGVYNGYAYLFIMQSNQLRYFSTTATVFGSVPTATDTQFSKVGNLVTVKSGGTSQTTTIATSIGNLKNDAQKQIALFAMNDGSRKSKIRAYSYAFTEQDGTVQRNFVPARRLSDGKVGLLDLAHVGTVNEFYANAASGEDFTAGSVTNEVHAGELHVDVAHGVTIQNTDVAITGSLTLVKDGAGMLVTDKTQTNIGGADICSGTLQYGVYPGAAGSPVTVYENAVFDLAGKSKDTKTQFVLAGGELRNTMADVGASTAQNYVISVVSNSTLNATTSVGMIGSGYAATTLDLGGNELDVGIASGKSFWLDNAAVTAGTLKLTGAGTLAIDKTSLRAATADFDLGCSKVTVAVPAEVHDLTVQPGTTVSGAGVISVNGTYRPIGDSVSNYTLKDGATLDLSAWRAAFDVTGKTLAFADGATIFVIPGERGGWLVKWDALPTNVTFQLSPDQRGVLTVTDEGIFLDRGLTIFFR